ncbi:hypothetical protein MNBD_GAMMA09-1099 [hydrothermal vent metagenome]|uniref:Polyketide cyclase/dehydrase n=1 Tax=hydrothermal vent metagenome TaxID=652676 RepID=A0A3B0XKJ5_9ZZZZ
MQTINHYYNTSGKHILSLFGVTFLACIAYILLDNYSLKNSAALFVGIPVFMASALAIKTHSRHLTRNILMGLSLGLLASFIFLNEGSFCVPMTAPLFLLSGLVVSFSTKKFRQSEHRNWLALAPVFALSLLAIEGTSPYFTTDRLTHIEVTQNTNLSPAEIKENLSQNRQFTNIPLLLSWGFPQPVSVSGSGIQAGDIRDIYFSGGEGEPGHTLFKVTERTENSVKFELLKDESHIGHWLQWKSSEVSWQTDHSGKTRITWNIEYDRQLSPSWYFSPIQKLAVSLAAEALIQNMILNPL